MTELSIVVPVYNESGNIRKLHKEIVDICMAKGYRYELIFVDDGSTDDTAKVAKDLAPLTFLKLRRNFGQTAALDAGIKHAQYENIITMDGDGQNDPNDIPKLVEHMNANGLDVVSGWRKNRKDSFSKKLVSRVANFLRGLLVKDDIHDSGCTLKIYKKECFKQITLYGEMHRFMPALLKIKGYKIGEVVVNHRARQSGVTKYNWKRTIKGFLDMISIWFWNKYAVRPLHLLGGIGMLLFILSGFFGVYSTYLYLTLGKIGHTAWPILTAFSFFGAVNMIIFGLIADVLAKTYYSATPDRSYNVESISRRD